jgi:hypothetical protein
MPWPWSRSPFTPPPAAPLNHNFVIKNKDLVLVGEGEDVHAIQAIVNGMINHGENIDSILVSKDEDPTQYKYTDILTHEGKLKFPGDAATTRDVKFYAPAAMAAQIREGVIKIRSWNVGKPKVSQHSYNIMSRAQQARYSRIPGTTNGNFNKYEIVKGGFRKTKGRKGRKSKKTRRSRL